MGGGCINHALRVEVDPGPAVFVKWNPDPPESFFEAEVDGLEALRKQEEQGGPRIPRPLGHGAAPGGGPGWLVLEHLEEGRPGRHFGAELGRAVARLHRPGGTGTGHSSPETAPGAADPTIPGWHRDNFIGSLPQGNAVRPDWAAFWREERLEPQVRMARETGRLDAGEAAELGRLLDAVDDLLKGIPAEGVSLLHGDLWSGNIHVGPEGEPVLLDPAVYRGHREVDLAMADLFGGFPRGFGTAYREAFPVDEAYEAVRRHLYQLYPLLVHVNLFGRGYVGGTLAAARRALGG